MPLSPAPAPEQADLTEKVWYSTAEALRYLGYKDRKTVSRAYMAGRLQGVRTAPTTRGGRGGNLKFRREWLDRFAAGEPPLDAVPARRSA